jgi:hypothetical protein
MQVTPLTYFTQVLAILYQGYQAAKEEPRLLGTVENEVNTSKLCTAFFQTT